ncbi:MAG: SCO family protein [Pseudomonadota bacterium]
MPGLKCSDVLPLASALLVAVLLLAGMVMAPYSAPAYGEVKQQHQHQQHGHHHQHQHHGAAGDGNDGSPARSVTLYVTPDVTLLDANGKAVPLRDSLDGGGPVMLNFIFTTCTAVCPVMSATFAEVQQQLGPERDSLRMVSVSIDPEHDTPEKLRNYAHKFGAGPQWQMLTGNVEDSIAVQRAFDIYRGDKMNHQPATFLRAGPDQPWVRLDGFASAADLLREYRQLAEK